MMRLDKFLADAGVGTRTELKTMIRQGRVTVDGAAVKKPETKVDEQQDIRVDGAAVKLQGTVVLLLHKPAGYVTSTSDPRDKTVMELLPREYQKLFPVGRLDKETEGLLLFTNDGDLLHRLISPKKEVPKIYYARHEGQAEQADIEAFQAGLTLRDGTVCRPAELTPLSPGESLIQVCEGKYHQVRRMMASRGLTVTYLERRQEGSLTLGDLPRGQTRELTEVELAALEQGE